MPPAVRKAVCGAVTVKRSDDRALEYVTAIERVGRLIEEYWS
jgi:hypothetical protein